MANTFETVEVVFPSGVAFQATRVLSSGGAEGDKPEGWVQLFAEHEGQEFQFGARGPVVTQPVEETQ